MAINQQLLRGSLNEFGLAEILQMLGFNRMTGVLYLRQANRWTAIIYFVDGAIAACTDLHTEALTIGDVLQQLNLATAEQIERAYAQQLTNPLGKRLGEILVDMRTITPEQLNEALSTQVLWIVRELARWSQGTYEFLPGQHLAPRTGPEPLDVTRATMEILRYTHEWEPMARWLPNGMCTQLKMNFDPPASHPLTFDLDTWQLISRVTMFQSVRRIATAVRRPELDVARLIVPLVRDGLLTVLNTATKPGLPGPAARLSLESFDLFSLLISMEQRWLRCKNPLEQLIALATFVNQTMGNLTETYRANGLALSDTSLQELLVRERVTGIDGYQFKIRDNQIDIEDFSQHCRRSLSGLETAGISTAADFFNHATQVLLHILRATFMAINSRVSSPIERQQNQEAWEALLAGFAGAESMN
jgi:hypothetical protein